MRSMSFGFLSRSLLFVVAASCAPTVPFPRRESAPPAASDRVSTQGVVLSVERPRPEDSQSFVHVVINPDDQRPIRLALAPGWYLDRQGLKFAPNDPIRVEGSRGSARGEPEIVVHRVYQGERSYILRDEQSRPVWLRPDSGVK